MKTNRSIRLFQTETEYNNEVSGFEYPTISLVKDVDEVKYMAIPADYSQHYFSQHYLTFEALESGTFTLTVPSSINSTYMSSISYSLDNGETWIDTAIDNTDQTITTPTVNAGGKVLWKGVGIQTGKSATAHCRFSSTNDFNIRGNIMSLLYGDDFQDKLSFPTDSTYTFYRLFYYSGTYDNNLIGAENLILPATTLTSYCYYGMFAGSKSLTTAPKLPATMLATGCYEQMFSHCSSLTIAPALPATTLKSKCYNRMFNGCTALTSAPELPATTLARNCYSYMFQNCSNLNYIKAMFTTTPSTTYSENWVNGVAATGTFVKNSAATWTTTGVNGVPTGWTVQTAAS